MSSVLISDLLSCLLPCCLLVICWNIIPVVSLLLVFILVITDTLYLMQRSARAILYFFFNCARLSELSQDALSSLFDLIRDET
jgi:hypothetical protein